MAIRRFFKQLAAHREVVEELRTNPIGGYGLYHLMDDAGMLSKSAKKELEPLIIKVENRLRFKDEDLIFELPLNFEPISDEEYDTLTFLIAELIRKFVDELPHASERLRLAELIGINDTLHRHIGHTSSLRRELSLEQILAPILHHCGEVIKPVGSRKIHVDLRPGDYFLVRSLARSKRYLPGHYLAERRLNREEVVRVHEVWGKGYFVAKRMNHTARYTRRWKFFRLRKRLPKDNTLAVVYAKEGRIYRLPTKFMDPIHTFTQLFEAHAPDYSYDPERYQPYLAGPANQRTYRAEPLNQRNDPVGDWDDDWDDDD